ncbi:HVO_0476 family zinc finger protein [Methermicoccus shengliensis]|uniref:Archaeal Zn-finger protein n=1 Tax=Methermicoccus shengliensis TaxID=660064 RepID=A0A832RTR4_9EURY|nr:HVO_0476 family zinc finger protein [Methermicoccus shengliensis]KUK04126.1 MAG: putative archaeal Zn-finger protein [Euryarchaeota archaeon 55_53]KUK29970.1 MAG: putative archaeal Zn-finger protein [Methanosarcinales archeaon 56_1174]MDI3487976.1 hypothetical protein [Methanosarcinales archaeon]MDN5295572.1 hypothetical protein [Methanosarcinales archaeon]HIH70363.1 hypothetical protein [Methermicoccus shengliensis]
MTERLSVECPMCMAHTPHVVLKQGAHMVVRCSRCGTVHAHQPLRVPSKMVRVVVSTGEHSEAMSVRIDADEVLEVGMQRLFDDEESGNVRLCEITALEAGARRPRRAHAHQVDTVWARAIDEVELKVSYPEGPISRSLSAKVDGSLEVVVGDTYTLGGCTVRVEKIKIRNGGYISRRGGSAPAYAIKRVFAKRV